MENMPGKMLILSLLCISMTQSALLADNSSPCEDGCQSLRVTARHIENKGIGYNTGYTTLETFLAAPADRRVVPFIDLRGHIFNDGHWAANGGLGLRSLLGNRIYGGYAYYDYRDTKHKSYNQVSFGVETLGTLWSLRFNGYVVLGSRKSHPYDLQFSQFAGNSLYYTQKQEYALSGGNGELGFYPLKMQDLTLYTGIGPYYLKGPVSTGVWGGQTRAKVMWKDYVGAEANYSYDHVFKNIVQGQVFLSYPLGSQGKVRGRKNRSCIDNALLCQRMIEPVAKNEIIPINTKKSKNLAINPATGLPYTVWFVNNLSHSAGTYESPFSTLANAQNASQSNDIIYVYPGDLTSTGLSNGITLKNGQQLLGATVSQNLTTKAGSFVIPAQVSGNNPPLLTNGGGAVVTLANNNVVSGLYLQNTAAAGILASGSNNVTLTQNYIQGNSLTYYGIELDNVTGTVTASSNTVITQAACVNIDNSSAISDASYLFTDSTFHTEGGNYGFNIAYTEGSNNTFLSSNNNLYSSGTAGINIACSNTTLNTPHVFTITDCNIGTEGNYALVLTLNNESVSQLNVQNSVINSVNGIETVTNNGSFLTSTMTGNLFNGYEHIVDFNSHNSSAINITFTNNTIYSYQSPFTLSCADTSTFEGSISNNAVTATYYGINVNTSDSSNFKANINDNVISSCYYHMDIGSEGASNYSGNIIGNTFIGLDDDDTIYWSIDTSGIVSSTIANNTFTGNYGAIDLGNAGSGSTTLNILNNTIQNSGTVGVNIDNSGTDFGVSVSNNTFQGFSGNAVIVANSGGEMCLQFNNNSANPYPSAYVIGATGGTLNLITPTGNLGHLQTTGVTPVTQCP